MSKYDILMHLSLFWFDAAVSITLPCSRMILNKTHTHAHMPLFKNFNLLKCIATDYTSYMMSELQKQNVVKKKWKSTSAAEGVWGINCVQHPSPGEILLEQCSPYFSFVLFFQGLWCYIPSCFLLWIFIICRQFYVFDVCFFISLLCSKSNSAELSKLLSFSAQELTICSMCFLP